MIVSTRDGRHHSQRTRDERLKDFLKKWKTLSDEEKGAVRRIIDEFNDLCVEGEEGFEDLNELMSMSPIYTKLSQNHFRGKLVSMEEFVKDDYYLGATGRDLWNKWFDDLEEFFAGNYVEAVISGSIGSGKTTWCEIALLRMFYEMTMLIDPQSTFGLMPGSEILIVCFNRDDTLARNVTYGGVYSKLTRSPYFKDIGCKMKKGGTILPDMNVQIIPVSVRSAKALGRNVFGGIIDETDFLEGSSISGKERSVDGNEESFASRLHSSIMRRMKSRYDRAGILPGKLMMSSSAKNTASFTNQRIADAQNDPTVFCRDYALYDVAPEDRFSKERFWVLVGTERIRHRILSDHEYYDELGPKGIAYLEQEGCKFLHVPENFRPDFERNIEDSVRDIGGIVTVSKATYIQLRDKIHECVDTKMEHPMHTETWVMTGPAPIKWNKLCHYVKRRIGTGRWEQALEPIRHPDSPRHVHIDLSLGKTDAAGLCIAHSVDSIDVERRTSDGRGTSETAPLIEVDLLLRVEPAPNQEIDIGMLRSLVYEFVEHGFDVTFASMDKFQSAESIQKFNQQGIKGEIVSVDSKYEPYDYCKLAIYEGRLSYYKYPILLNELESLIRDQSKGMIDHPQGGSKDVSDSLAGAVFTLSTKSIYSTSSVSVGVSEYESRGKDDAWIRSTMSKKGEKPLEKISDPEDLGNMIVTG